MATSAAYCLRAVEKVRSAAGTEFRLTVPSLDIGHGDMIGLVGPSGCGKSTLLDLLAMVLQPSSAERFVFQPLGDANIWDIASIWGRRRQNDLSELRKRHIGYILQTGGLLPFLSVRENIALSRELMDLPDDGTVGTLAGSLGIAGQLNKLPGRLSVGERQRVAIARALAHRPTVVIADEPTASLDPSAADTIMRLFLDLARRRGHTVIVASHDHSFVSRLGLRVLQHRLSRSADGRGTISTFSD